MAKHLHPCSERTNEGFDAKAQKLLRTSGYDFENLAPFRELSLELTGVTTLNKSKTYSTRVPRASAFSKLGGPASKIDDKDSGRTARMKVGPKEDSETESLIPSRTKRKTKIDVGNDGILKAKRRTIVINGKDPLKYVMAKIVLSGHLTRWSILFNEFDIALIIGLQMALEQGIPSLVVSGDSKLVINQLLKEYEVKKEDLVPYFRYASISINKFDSVELEHFVNNGSCPNCLTAKLRRLVLSQSESLRLKIIGNPSSTTSSMEGEDKAAQAMDEAHSGV
ncbi:hypothetical protein RJ640_018311 [Escallonia rubra]|uniref:RNase H type-1 domain-containing protein n=1 Tax=Escallonia rubra TaxID=112253 RepID=A0AA88US64_9ASTE|nr:hypothetical protein RJ640_018311 [Escallonia rubra]